MNRSLVYLGSLALVSLAFMSCKDKTEETGDSSETCTITIETYPAADATDFYYRSAVEFYLSAPDTSADPTVTLTSGGADVAGTVSYSDDKTTVYFTPSAPLNPGADYTATLASCRGDTTINFRTSELGTVIDSSVDLKAGSYVLDLAEARFLQPEVLGSIVQTYLTMNILIGVTSYDTSTIEMMGAISVEGGTTQDFCQPTIAFPEAADFSEQPFFQVGPADVNFNFEGMAIPIHDLEVSGTFAPDGSYFGGGVLGGQADARDIAKLGVADLTDPQVICDTIQTVGAACEPCTDGQSYCLTVRADSIQAVRDAAVLEVVADSNCHAQCTENAKDCVL